MHHSAPACPAVIKQAAALSNYSHLSKLLQQRSDCIEAFRQTEKHAEYTASLILDHIVELKLCD